MDNDDYKYAEFILQALKQKPKNLASTVAEYTYSCHKGQSIKELLNFDHIFKHLEKIGLITIEYNKDGRGKPQSLELSEIGNSINSVSERIQQIKHERYNQQKKLEKEQEFINDQSEYYKRHNLLAKYWYLIAASTALIGAFIQKIFNVL